MKFKRQAAIVDLIGKQEIKTQEELSEKLRKTAKPGDIIWLKASRGMRFEDIAEAFYEET